jgi:hypothetical protein
MVVPLLPGLPAISCETYNPPHVLSLYRPATAAAEIVRPETEARRFALQNFDGWRRMEGAALRKADDPEALGQDPAVTP